MLSFFTAWARSLDVITDPVMAWVSDQTKSRYGRRRPYILVGAPFYALFLTLFFSPPTNMSGEAQHYNSLQELGWDLQKTAGGGGGGLCNSLRTALYPPEHPLPILPHLKPPCPFPA